MADKKISALTGATTPLAGTEVLPIVQGSATVKVSVDNLTVGKTVTTGKLLVGSGLTSATWAGFYQPIQMGGGFNLSSYNGANLGYMTYNAYYDVGDWKYDHLGLAARYSQEGGDHKWWSAVSGSAGGVISWVQSWGIVPTGNFEQKIAAKGVNFTANTPAAGMTSQLLNWYEEGTWTPNQGSGLVVVGAFTSSGTYTRVGRQVTVVGTIRGGTSVSASSAGQITSNLPFTASNLFVGSVINDTVTTSSGIYTSSASINAVEAITATPAIYFSVTYFV